MLPHPLGPVGTAKEMIKAIACDPTMATITDYTAFMRRCLEGPNFREGVQAFKQERVPQFCSS